MEDSIFEFVDYTDIYKQRDIFIGKTVILIYSYNNYYTRPCHKCKCVAEDIQNISDHELRSVCSKCFIKFSYSSISSLVFTKPKIIILKKILV